MKPNLTGEKMFWTEMARNLNSGWDTALHPDFFKAGKLLSAYDAQIYVVDCRTGWIQAGAVRGEDLLKIKNTLPAVRQALGLSAAQVSGMAAVQILKASALARGAEAAASDEIAIAIKAAANALADTRTIQIVLEAAHQLAGHWIYMVYSLKNGESLGRPMFTNTEEGGLMNADKVLEITRSVISQDMASPQSTVGALIVAGGGGQWHPTLA